MAINTTRLDRFISDFCQVNRKAVRLMLAQKRVFVDGKLATDVAQIVDYFSYIKIDEKVAQNNQPIYIMLYKPVGVVCATKDKKHKTVIDLLKQGFSEEVTASLHIVGRLDLNTSGLVLLTNDSRWSEQLTLPDRKVNKYYQVTLAKPLSEEYISAFAQGMYFDFEKITTKPVILNIISTHKAEVILTEGRYHQIKRMFGRFRNPVVGLHRFAIGKLTLDESLNVGENRCLDKEEVTTIGD